MLTEAQGCLRNNGHLLAGLLCHGLPCPCRESELEQLDSTTKLIPVQSKRLFHVITSFITTFAAISYYAMAVGDGIYKNTLKVVDPSTVPGIPDTYYLQSREVYWARYVDCKFDLYSNLLTSNNFKGA